jgi:hypothetical protein
MPNISDPSKTDAAKPKKPHRVLEAIRAMWEKLRGA